MFNKKYVEGDTPEAADDNDLRLNKNLLLMKMIQKLTNNVFTKNSCFMKDKE